MDQYHHDIIACVISTGGSCPFLTESITSLFGVTSDIRFCTTSDDDSVVEEMRSIKRSVPTLFYDSQEDIFNDMALKNKWVIFIMGNEVIHEACSHFLWHFSVNHGDNYDGLMAPVLDVSTGVVRESFRVISPRLMRGDFFSKVFVPPPWARVAPSALFPQPIWSLSEGVAMPDCAPIVLRHLYGRLSYSRTYIDKEISR